MMANAHPDYSGELKRNNLNQFISIFKLDKSIHFNFIKTC
jgi:hypothetical protein